jgi:hypothetical protein
LVSRAKIGAALLALCWLSACDGRKPVDAEILGTVDPRAYDAFYLWPGMRPPEGTNPHFLYLLDGEIRNGGPARFTRLRPGAPKLAGKELWLVVRINRLDWSEAAYSAIFADLERWQAAGNRVIGLQIDFDAATKGIGGYAQFLNRLREQLPKQYKLSITGLMDWSANGDPRALNQLRTVIDEVVVQTYQGRSTIPGYQAYFAKMDAFPIPFRVALAQGGTWTPPPMLARHPMFRGYVVFVMR